jgi:hypothetical protein
VRGGKRWIPGGLNAGWVGGGRVLVVGGLGMRNACSQHSHKPALVDCAGPCSDASGSALEQGRFVEDLDGKLANTALCYPHAVPSCPALPAPSPGPSAGRKFPVSSGIPNLLLTEDEC